MPGQTRAAAAGRRRRPATPRERKPSRRGGPRPGADSGATRSAVFAAAAELFSRRGYDGVTVDDIAAAAGVNKAMIYYHFTDKLGLYRAIVCEMLDEAGARVSAIVAEPVAPSRKLERFIAGFIALADKRPYFPPLMLREMSEGALHLDTEILTRMRTVFLAFAPRARGRAARRSVSRDASGAGLHERAGPVLLNAARERAAAQPGRERLPMFVHVPHDELTRHMQHVALRMLSEGLTDHASARHSAECRDASRAQRTRRRTKCAPPVTSKPPKCASRPKSAGGSAS